MDEVPEDRCGYKTRYEEPSKPGNICCWRPSWQSGKYCIWHLDVDNKPIEELRKSQIDYPQRLDGLILRGVRIEGLNLEQCTLIEGDFSEGKFKRGDFTGADLRGSSFVYTKLQQIEMAESDLRNSDFSNSKVASSNLREVNITEANFSDAYLAWTCFAKSDGYNVNLSNANLEMSDITDVCWWESNLREADFTEANLTEGDFGSTDFTGVTIRMARVKNSNLSRTDFSNADMRDSNFSESSFLDSNLSNIDAQLAYFEDAELSEADLTNSNLEDADFTGSNARGVAFNESNLEDATFVRTELRDASLKDTRLYQTLFSDIRINSNTDFGDKSAYEDPDTDLNEEYDDTSRWEAAAWVYRRLQDLHEENAMSEKAQEYHIAKEEAQRREYRENGERFRWAVHTANYHLTRHGENLWQVAKSSAAVIGVCALLYPIFGGLANAEGTHSIWSLSDPSVWEVGLLFLRSLYFSTVTFTTLGYGDYHPVGGWSKALAGAESLAGALLVALFVFVLGRRVAR